MFLSPTSQQTVFPWHLPPILDVSNPRRFHWPYQILKWLRDAIRKFQDENREICGGCIFVLLVLYFQRLKHGPLHACQAPEPWIDEWIANELDKKADHVISQGCIVDNARKRKKQKKASNSKAVNEKARCKRPRKDSDQAPSIQGKTTSHSVARLTVEENGRARTPNRHHLPGAGPNLSIEISIRKSLSIYHANDDIYEYTPHECKPGTRRKLPIRRSRSRSGTKKAIRGESVPRSKGAPLVVSDSDDEDNVLLARRQRLFQQQSPPQDVNQAEPMVKDDHKGAQEENLDHKDASPHTPSAAHVQLTEYDFDSEFDISIVQCPKFEQVLNNVEQRWQTKAISMQPLQTVMPNKSCYHTLSPGRPSFSLGLTQLEKTPTPSPIHSIHPSLRNIKKGETKEKQIRAWILNSSLNKEQHLASYEGWEHMVIQWMCYSFNDTKSSRFKRDFYCVCPGILESVTQNDNLASFIDGARPIYAGLGRSFSEDTRFFDKLEAAKRKWWVYAFEVNAKCLVIIDSLHSAPQDDERDKLDAYVGRVFEDMARIAIPAFVRTTYGPSRSYARVPKQPNK
ncbi:uncharacterized protein DS421_14g459760 [Arachis hypogaea]|nr:uncharacterized protein DS421_14g459760 [Arachis hypogaea]